MSSKQKKNQLNIPRPTKRLSPPQLISRISQPAICLHTTTRLTKQPTENSKQPQGLWPMSVTINFLNSPSLILNDSINIHPNPPHSNTPQPRHTLKQSEPTRTWCISRTRATYLFSLELIPSWKCYVMNNSRWFM